MTQSADMSDSYHYQLIARAISLMQKPDAPQTLEGLSAALQLSPAHFQRLFSQWVGISPKRYQQYLSLDLARSLMRDRHTTLATAETLGLSSTGRLHDLFLAWEAMSPGDFARGAAGLAIRYGWFDSPFGPAIVMGTDRGICGMGFAAEMGQTAAFDDLAQRWPAAQFHEDPESLRPAVAAAFGQSRQNADTKLFMIGAPFQLKVWQALLRIPSGQVTTYGDIATFIGHPKAVRAVGTAVGRNPISLLIPCHRVLRKEGALGGYHWGLEVKQAILGREAAQFDAA